MPVSQRAGASPGRERIVACFKFIKIDVLVNSILPFWEADLQQTTPTQSPAGAARARPAARDVQAATPSARCGDAVAARNAARPLPQRVTGWARDLGRVRSAPIGLLEPRRTVTVMHRKTHPRVAPERLPAANLRGRGAHPDERAAHGSAACHATAPQTLWRLIRNRANRGTGAYTDRRRAGRSPRTSDLRQRFYAAYPVEASMRSPG